MNPSRRRRATRLDPTGLPPDRRALVAAREAVTARAIARVRAANGEDVEIPAVPQVAEALVLADAVARGVDPSDPATLSAMRADLVDRIARAVGAD